MKILNKATKATHQHKLAVNAKFQRYSQFPVHETEFWAAIFDASKSAKGAAKILQEIEIIENEPCIENSRVWNNVQTAKSMAKLTLMQSKSMLS